VRHGFIARTLGPGSVTIDQANPFRIIQKGPHPSGGLAVTRIGQKTGWRNGTVVSGRTCEDTKTIGRSWSNLRCQTFATYYSEGGDSGSPVFRQLGGADVALLGVHWGREGDFGDRVFSAIGQVEKDLGRLSVLDPAYTPPPPSAPEPCEPEPPAIACEV
jgi:V8-like Glu-specific endopeptidase